jgi:hypothetical protein
MAVKNALHLPEHSWEMATVCTHGYMRSMQHVVLLACEKRAISEHTLTSYKVCTQRNNCSATNSLYNYLKRNKAQMLINSIFITHTSTPRSCRPIISPEYGRPLLILEQTNAEMYALHLLIFVYFSQAP